LVLLTIFSFVCGYIGVLTALFFTFLLPGLICYRFFNLKSHEVLAFIPIFSVLVSVSLVYYLSLAFGYSRNVILLSFFVLTAIYTFVVYKKGQEFRPQSFLKIRRFKRASYLVFLVVFLISLAVLSSSVWYGNEYGIVITGSNWQDTPLHYEIIESLNNGNFPPQMPNFSGEKMTYHYFVNYHTAIVERMYGYLPTLLPVLNAIFIVVFAFAIYALARPSGRRVAVIATVLAVFGWGFSYFGLFSALISGQFNPAQNYIYQYGGMFGLPSIFDNLLQQRPLLVGLPVFALVLALLRTMDDKRRILLAGVLTGLAFQFHNIAFFCCYVAYFVSLLNNLKQFKISFLYFLVPSILVLPFILSGGPHFSPSLSSAWIANFAQNPFIYYFLNLGIPFVLAIISFIKPGNTVLKGTLLFLILIPNTVLLTPNPWDMYKFFIFAWIPIAVLSAVILAKLPKVVVLTLVMFSVLTSASVIAYNVGTSYPAASWSEYELGLWVRENTPEGSVFLTYYSIHAPTGMVGGRLRVSSYVNWVYGHGVLLEEVWRREQQINQGFNGTVSELESVVKEYNVNYVYLGREELRVYPHSLEFFNSIDWLTTVYSDGNLRIYLVEYEDE
jgi:hypothetical protein